MRTPILLGVVMLVWNSSLAAQCDGAADPSCRKVTIMAGIGNIFAGFGSTVEVFPFHKQVGLVGGIGYVPDSDNGVSGAGALRLYTGGERHRLFLEGSFEPVAVSVGNFSQSTHYGFGGAAGYSYTARRGFTLLISGGLGRTTRVADTEALLSLGVGYTWR